MLSLMVSSLILSQEDPGQDRIPFPAEISQQHWFTPHLCTAAFYFSLLKTKCCCVYVLYLGYCVSLECTRYFKIHQV